MRDDAGLPEQQPRLGPLGEKFDGVERIAVLRGGALGDLISALPALDALAAAYPAATLTLLGTPQHRLLLQGRNGPVETVEILPIVPGVREPAGPPGANGAAAPTVDDFFQRMRERHFDLAVQLHGGGGNSNPFLLRLGARYTVGCATPDAPRLDRNLQFSYYQHELLRWLEVAGLAGAPAVRLHPRLAVSEEERETARQWIEPDTRGLVSLHPGASDPRRRWPARHFGLTAARLAEAGFQVLVIGDGPDVDLADQVVAEAHGAGPAAAVRAVRSVAGKLELPVLAGLLASSAVMLGNDSGPRHLAQAVGARTASIYWCGNVINAGPLSRSEHRLQISWTVSCPVCGASMAGERGGRCGHDVSFVADVDPEAVLADVLALV
ncbi:MAG TPA: glycosyltransferase family 9 protein [Micrococcaceae bacterium]|jgi:ADP-heptose:LPS heptosyltransferase|nr:glycosyltransferase family 9 protein [Micrococcaceae bacterium]